MDQTNPLAFDRWRDMRLGLRDIARQTVDLYEAVVSAGRR